MKFKSDIEVQAGLKDSSGSVGTSGQVLSTTATGVSWINVGVGGYVPYTGATANVDLGAYALLASDLIINHSSGSGVAASITKGGSGEALTVVKTSGSGNAASITGGITLLTTLNLTNALADTYISSASNWNAAYNDKINSASVTGTTTKTLTLNQQDGGTITASWTESGGGVTSFNTRTGAVTLTSSDVTTALGYTPTNVTIGTANGLSISGQALSLALSSTSTTGALSSTDWNTFNGKQALLNGTGFVKASGTTISYDNSTYTPTSRTLTINGTTYDLSANRSWTVSGGVTSVSGTGGYGGLTLTGTVTSTGNLTLGGTPTGTWPISVSGNADTVDGYHAAGLLRSDGGVWNPGANITLGQTANGQEWSFDITRNGFTGGYWHVWDSVHSSMLSVDATGNFVTATGSFRSPIFYDSNDTAYYGDFASTSNFSKLLLNSQNSFNTTTPGLTSYGLTLMGGAADYANGVIWTWGNTNAQAGVYVQSSGAYGTKMYLATTDSFATGSKTAMSIDHSGTILVNRSYLQSDSSLRAPIFYDSNNTGYYIDPASSSNVNNLTVAGTFSGANNVVYGDGANGRSKDRTSQSANTSDSSNSSGFYFGNATTGMPSSDWWNWLTVAGNNWGGSDGYRWQMTGSFWSDDWRLRRMTSGSWSGWVSLLHSGNYSSYSNFGSNAVYGGIYYDGNNTGYYCDPASTSNLNVVQAAGGFFATSDERTKENIVTIDNALDKVNALRGVYYNQKNSEYKKDSMGVIAQEVMEVVPEVVGQGSNGMYNVAYGNLAGLFIEAIKEQQVQIEHQQTQIEELKQLVNKLINK
jgi:hypothetical protein